MVRRLRPLWTAVALAAGFIGLRVVYRVVFGGAGGDGLILLDLPRLRLSGPFEHIMLFGRVTTGGVVSAASSALPFAGLVLVFGVLASIVDIRRLLTRGAVRGPVRTVARALVVAWATFPALVESVRRVRTARELRGERSVAALIVPVLEQTVERAIALGASMEVRGFSATRRATPLAGDPAAIVDGGLGFDGRWILEGVDLSFERGTLTLVTGATGSGKSTLLHSMSGLFQHLSDGDQSGIIRVAGVDRLAAPPRETASFVGVVSQSVRLSFVASTVAEELGFALALQGVVPQIVEARVQEISSLIGIGHLLDRELTALSAGEACLVAIGAALVAEPVLLLVDEPLADLDHAARERVVGVLDALAHRNGVCVVVAEHSMREWGTVPDRRLELRDGAAHVAGSIPHSELDDVNPSPPPNGVPLAEVRNLSVTHGDRIAVDDAAFQLFAGELVAVTGANGAGKSSLLHAMARPAGIGTVIVDGQDVRLLNRRARRRAVSLVPEAFDDLLFATTVAVECRRADRVAGAASTAAMFRQFVGDGLDRRGLMDRHPRDLSAGERLCLVLAIQLSTRPRVILVDEPSRGLDADARRLVGEALGVAAAEGSAVVMATHDRDFAASYSTRELRMAAGRIDSAIGVAR